MDALAGSDRGVVVLGVGNVLMGDEGAGVRCVDLLDRDHRLPADVRVIDGGTSTHELLEDLEHLHLLVIVDAVASGRPPGTVVSLEDDAVPSAFSNKLSPHQHGINDLLAKLKFLGRAPRRVVLVGVEPAKIALGFELSAEIRRAMPILCDRVVEAVQSGNRR